MPWLPLCCQYLSSSTNLLGCLWFSGGFSSSDSSFPVPTSPKPHHQWPKCPDWMYEGHPSPSPQRGSTPHQQLPSPSLQRWGCVQQQPWGQKTRGLWYRNSKVNIMYMDTMQWVNVIKKYSAIYQIIPTHITWWNLASPKTIPALKHNY